MNRISIICVKITKDLIFLSLEFQKGKRKSIWKKVFEEVLVVNFPKLVKDINLDIQEARWTPNVINPKISLPWYVIIKLLTSKDREENLINREK